MNNPQRKGCLPRRVVKFTPLNTKQIALTIWGGWLTEWFHTCVTVFMLKVTLLKMASSKWLCPSEVTGFQTQPRMSVSLVLDNSGRSHFCQDIALGRGDGNTALIYRMWGEVWGCFSENFLVETSLVVHALPLQDMGLIPGQELKTPHAMHSAPLKKKEN